MNEQPPSSLTAALARGLVTRRTVMAGAAGVGALALAGCGSKGRNPTTSGSAAPTAKAAQDMSATEKVVNWSNWPEYIDTDDDTGEAAMSLPSLFRRPNRSLITQFAAVLASRPLAIVSKNSAVSRSATSTPAS